MKLKLPQTKHLAILAAILAAVAAGLAFIATDIMFGLLFTVQAVVMIVDAVVEHKRGERLNDAAKVVREHVTEQKRKKEYTSE